MGNPPFLHIPPVSLLRRVESVVIGSVVEHPMLDRRQRIAINNLIYLSAERQRSPSRHLWRVVVERLVSHDDFCAQPIVYARAKKRFRNPQHNLIIQHRYEYCEIEFELFLLHELSDHMNLPTP